jgi:hypothetical protein
VEVLIFEDLTSPLHVWIRIKVGTDMKHDFQVTLYIKPTVDAVSRCPDNSLSHSQLQLACTINTRPMLPLDVCLHPVCCSGAFLPPAGTRWCMQSHLSLNRFSLDLDCL